MSDIKETENVTSEVVQEVAAENNWPLSVATDEVLYAGFKKLGKI